jgi:hypothetical protein
MSSGFKLSRSCYGKPDLHRVNLRSAGGFNGDNVCRCRCGRRAARTCFNSTSADALDRCPQCNGEQTGLAILLDAQAPLGPAHTSALLLMERAVGFEPTQCQDGSLVPFRLATPAQEWSREWELNPRPRDYRSRALPAELSLDAAVRSGAGCRSRTRVACL